ncbi:MAG: FtsX-like permease family protein [Oscillospiraceae bacterium]|nr:FtsX-like permease family protein [Oscillospiraceae bacterium]
MFFNILKKDLKRKKSMNIILLLFITLCTVFTASSVSNLIVIMNAVSYYGEQSNIADFFVWKTDEDTERFEEWLSALSYTEDFEREVGIIVTDENFINDDYLVMRGLCLLTRLPEKFNFPLGDNNLPVPALKNGQIVLSRYDARRSELEIGDEITLRIGDRQKTFTLAYTTRDIIFGSPYIDTKRLIISEDDYDYFLGAESALYNLYSVLTPESNAVRRELQKQDFLIQMSADRSMIETTLTLELVMAALLILIGIVLIIIAFAILRFTIVFTLQEDYREIGIMKAIGLSNSAIKNIYIIKYFAIALIGVIIGTIISIPFGTMMLEGVQQNMAIQSDSSIIINIICGIVIIGLVILFCYLSAGSVDKFTAIQAIRGGATGERFKKRRFFRLNRRRRIPTVLYMAFNSILSAVKSYTVLVITFILGTLLIVMPLNALNTLTGDEIIYVFGVSKSDVYIESTEPDSESNTTKAGELEELYKQNGIDIELNTVLVFLPWVYTDDIDSGAQVMALQSLVYTTDRHKNFTAGIPPVLSNEIAMTELNMNRLAVVIGDTVNIKIGADTKQYIITASMQSMNNMGDSLMFPKTAELDAHFASITTIHGDFINRTNITGQIERMKELTPDLQIKTASEYLALYIGNSIDMVGGLKSLILAVVLFINCLITILLVRAFVTRERGEISLMKNIGFTNRSIKLWQIMRIGVVLLISAGLGILLSNPLNPVMTRYTFGIMGAPKMPLNIVAFEVYFFYPLILFLGTIAAAVFGAIAVNKIDFKEINNVE